MQLRVRALAGRAPSLGARGPSRCYTFAAPPSHRNQRAAPSANQPQPSRQETVAMASTSGSNGAGPSTTLVPISELRSLCSNALKTLGYKESEVEILTEILMYAQLRENNQGIIKITSGGMNRSSAAGEIFVEKETRLSALINGNGNAGMLALHRATTMALDRARSQGFGIVGTHHTATSTGALGYYVDKIGRDGYIGLALAQSPEFVAPHGARKAIFGTNPIAISVPADGGPVTMDMATAAYAWFGVLQAKTAGVPLPPGVAINAAGADTTSPQEVLDGGAIKVFDDSHKSSNLALMVELLAGPLVGAAIADKLSEKNWGNLVVAVDPGLLGDKAAIQRSTRAVLNRVKSAERQPGVSEILLPGERGDRLAATRTAAGSLPVESNLLNNLRVMAAKATSGMSPGAPAAAAAAPSSSSNGASSGSSAGGNSSSSGSRSGGGGLHIATQLVHPQYSVVDPYAATAPPLWQTATFAQPSATTNGEYDYTRSGNPTRSMLEESVAALEGGDRCFAFTSGMAAIAVACRLVKAGEHILAGEDIYGGTSRLLANVVPASGVAVSNVDMTDLSAVAAGLQPGRTKLVIVESPTNPRLQVCDIAAICDLAHAAGALVMVDNSIMAPVFQRPLHLGADISMTSGTKFVGGHSDVTLGLLSVKGAELAKRVYYLQNAEGAGLAPFDCWLALRGLKTMALRMERQADNCAKMAAWLAAHPLVRSVNYAGLPTHRGAAIHARQATSGGSLLSFTTGDVNFSKALVEASKLFKVTVSFGNVTSQISLPCYMSHASIPADVRAARGLPDDLVRISAGIEHVDDLIADLEQAMAAAVKKVGRPMPPPPTHASLSGNGNGALSAEREAQLLQRIRELEAQLVAKSGKA